jgi:CHAT domain-containing protein
MKSQSRLGIICCLTMIFATFRCVSKKNISTVPPLESAEVFLAKANEFTANAQFDGANFYLQKALEVFKSAQHWEPAVQCLVQIGNNWQKIGDLQQAKKAFDQALQMILTRNGLENIEFSKSLQQLAFKFLAQKEYTQALDLFNQALAIQQKIYGNDHPELSKIYNNLALVYLHMGNSQKANEFSNKSLSSKLRKFLNTDSSFLRNYSFLDGLNITERSFQDMSGMLDKSLGVYLESLGGQNPLVASIYEKIGMVYSLQGSHEQGLDFFRKALRIWEDDYGEEHIQVALLYEDIGICLRLKGELDNARRFLNQALDIALDKRQPLILSSIYYQSGKVLYLQNRYHEALQNYQLSLKAMVPGFSPRSSSENPVVEMGAEKQDLLEILTAKAETLEALAGSAESSGISDLSAAMNAIQGAVRLIDLLRIDYKAENYRLVFGEKSQQIFDLAVQIAIKLYKMTGIFSYKEDAFIFSEKSKAALLSENMLESNARQFAGIPADQLVRERELKNELAQCETLLEKQSTVPLFANSQTLSDLKNRYYAHLAEYQELIKSFENAYPQYYELKYKSKQISVAEFQKKLPAQAALIEYFLGSKNLCIFFLSRNKFEVISQPVENQFAETIEAYCRAIKKIDEKTFLQLSPRLFHILIAPLEDHLLNKTKLLIIPDRILTYLPFETLIRAESTASDFSQLDYLIRRHEVSYHFSGNLWLRQQQKEARSRPISLAGFAPVFSSGRKGENDISSSDLPADANKSAVTLRTVTLDGLEFPELPGTEDELRSILALCSERKIKAIGYFHDQASEELFKSPVMKDFSIIHLATHSIKNETNPKLSGFLFSPPANNQSREDGILYAEETYNLNLDCDLLVLSSCESGSGRLVEGEGVLALTRGLFYSGASGIIFSLWKVEDRASGELMIKLYQEILQGKPYAEALKKAKLSFIANPFTAFPKYWAGFIILGT